MANFTSEISGFKLLNFLSFQFNCNRFSIAVDYLELYHLISPPSSEVLSIPPFYDPYRQSDGRLRNLFYSQRTQVWSELHPWFAALPTRMLDLLGNCHKCHSIFLCTPENKNSQVWRCRTWCSKLRWAYQSFSGQELLRSWCNSFS